MTGLALGIDLGTSYFKTALVDRGGTIRGMGRAAAPVEARRAGFREVPVPRFWGALEAALGAALAEAGARPADVRAVSYSSQANSFLLLNEAMEPLTPFILWSDRRAERVEPEVEEVFRHPEFPRRTGLGIRGGEMAVAKLAWIRRRQGGVWARARRFMTVSDYLAWSLCGETIGDAATASLLAVWDPREMRYWDFALEKTGLEPAMLSRPLRPGTPAGACRGPAAARLGIPPGASFAAGSLDHHAAAVGAGVGAPYGASESTGTVLACLALARRYQPRENACLGPHTEEGAFYRLAFSGMGAGSLEWYRGRFAPALSMGQLDRLAAAVPIGCEGLRAEDRPEGYPGLDGFAGRLDRHGHGHFFRAILERIGLNLQDLLSIVMEEGAPDAVVATGGGAASDLWLQIKADLTGVTFARSSSGEPGAFGAAMFAARAAGWYATLAGVAQAWLRPADAFHPVPEHRAAYRRWAAGAAGR